MNIIKKKWIGLLHVSTLSRDGILGDVSGAYVNVLALVENSDEFIEKVKEATNELGLEFIGIDDSEPLSERMKKFKINDELVRISKEVIASNELRFGTFHTYD